jgi:hypothetical protein
VDLQDCEVVLRRSYAACDGLVGGALILTDRRLVHEPAWWILFGRRVELRIGEITGVQVKNSLGTHMLLVAARGREYVFLLSGFFYLPYLRSWRELSEAWAQGISELLREGTGNLH